MLKIEGVSFSYGNEFKLSGIDLELKKGNLTAIIGPNGSGKSTVLKLALGYLKPTHGRIFFKGKNITKLSLKEKSKMISYLPQFAGLDIPFTVEQMIILGRNPWLGKFGFAQSQDFFPLKNLLKEFDLEHISERKFNGLSGGERQRALIAASIAQASDFLILDEPTASLDISYQVDIYKKLRIFASRGTTVLMASHNITLASVFSDEIVILKEGKVYSKGRPRDVIDEKTVRDVFGDSLSLVYQGESPLVFPRSV
ncbi:ABC transporter ATP-binding protein [candidate division WOR-3 bacterium]|nr:ABC transporter ATP-binding protein [candidate division WOR-3 bacterium]